MSSTATVFGLCVLLAFATATRAATDYCAAGICSSPGIHTACINPLLSWSTGCSSPNKALSVVTDTDKATIVNYHNDLRRKVAKGLETRGASGAQPSASNMRKLVWNQEIANIAQTLAQTCVYAHDKCRNLPGMYVGQNIAMTGSSAPVTSVNWKYAIDMWYSEVEFMTSAIVKAFGSYTPPKPVGHYTQAVWAATTQIGCGVSSYLASGWYNVYYVCNYGPGGNYINSPVYNIGAPASACPTGTAPQDGLCA